MARAQRTGAQYAIRRISDGLYWAGYRWVPDQFVYTTQRKLNIELGEQIRGRYYGRSPRGTIGGTAPEDVEIVELDFHEADVTVLPQWEFARRQLQQYG